MGHIKRNLFGNYEGRDIYRFTLLNANGNGISVINFGATIVSWELKDSNSVMRNIVAGFANLEDYVHNDIYLGCVAGRYANRIANGRFSIDGNEYVLACNNIPNHLHGGNQGFDKVVWDAVINEPEQDKLTMTYFSTDGEEGYPGNLKVKIEYSYTDNDELIIEYFAETDKATPVNLTSHAYFNLSGNMAEGILNYQLQINADRITALNDTQIPTGELMPVDNTAFDFREMRCLSERIGELDNGYDHNYVLNRENDDLAFAALLADSKNELQLSVHTTEPGLQLYSGNFLNGSYCNRDGKLLHKHAALCLETQHFPDSPNQPGFPNTILLPGQYFYSKTVYKIRVT